MCWSPKLNIIFRLGISMINAKIRRNARRLIHLLKPISIRLWMKNVRIGKNSDKFIYYYFLLLMMISVMLLEVQVCRTVYVTESICHTCGKYSAELSTAVIMCHIRFCNLVANAWPYMSHILHSKLTLSSSF
jgi:hypothetical protein